MKTVIVIGGSHSALIHAVSLMNCNNIVVAADREPPRGCLVDGISEHLETLNRNMVVELNGYNHEKLKGPVSHLDNQSFIQQKMQGKRRVY